MAFIVTLHGLREGTRWAWMAARPIAAAPIAIGIVYLPVGLLAYETGILVAVGFLGLVGQLLARPR